MQNLSVKLYPLLLLLTLWLSACTVISTEDIAPNETAVRINQIDADGWIFSDLILEGAEMDMNCADNSVSISDGSTSVSLGIKECTPGTITAWISEDVAEGVYKIEANIDGTTFTAIDGVDMEVEIKNRPVILSMSETTMEDGATITIEGLHLLNTSNVVQNDPKVWIMASGYTNTVSEITVNETGTEATVVMDDGIKAGEYDFLLTTDEWSNRIAITIL